MVHISNYSLQEANFWIGVLQGLNYQIMTERHALQSKSVQVGQQIKEIMSKGIDMIRTRESWLLSHLEEITRLKAEALDNQTFELTSLLAKLEVIPQLDEEDVEQQGMAQDLWSETFPRLSSLGLSPIAESFLGFEVNFSALEAAVIDLGRVVTKEEDVSQVLEPHKEMRTPDSICFADDVSESSSNVETFTWLVHPEKEVQREEIMVRGEQHVVHSEENTFVSEENDAHPNTHNGMSCEGISSYFDEVRSSALQKWITDEYVVESMEGLKTEQAASSKSDQSKAKLFAHFYQIASERNVWLQSKDGDQTDCNDVMDEEVPKFPYFAAAGTDIRNWLQRPISSCETTKEINLRQFRELAACPLSRWRNISSTDQHDKESSPPVPRPYISKGNPWLISSMEASDFEWNDSYSDVTSSIDQTDFLGSGLSVSSWLRNSKPTTMQEAQPDSPLSIFNQIRQTDCKSWLRSKPEDSMIKPDLCIWLARSSQLRCNDCPGSCSYDLFQSVNEGKTRIQSRQWLVQGTDW